MSRRSDKWHERRRTYLDYIISIKDTVIICDRCKQEVKLLTIIKTVIDGEIYNLCKGGCSYDQSSTCR
jgi:hypothetical protein